MDVVHIRVCGAAFLLSFCIACAPQKSVETVFPAYDEDRDSQAHCRGNEVPGQYLVEWEDGRLSLAHASSREELIETFVRPHLQQLRLVEPDYRVSQVEPSVDSQARENGLWGIARVEAEALWLRGYEGQGTVVAVIDSGLDRNHPQIRENLWINENEIPNNQIDDDANGFIDDVSGWDFVADSGEVEDINGHGTHVAGIVAADPLEGPVTGVAPKAKILGINFMDERGGGTLGHAALAIQYAADQGVHIINASWGGGSCSTNLRRSIEKLKERDILFVAASGNYGLDLDLFPEYPAAFNFSHQLTVGAIGPSDYTEGFSNYSFNLVHLVAPGSFIESLRSGGGQRIMSGTSMAAPFVAGAAALLKSARPQASMSEIRSAILNSVDVAQHPVKTQGRLNIRRALEVLDQQSQ